MKKRVLSMVLTLAMLLSAMTVLSFVSFGAGEAAQAVEKYEHRWDKYIE